MTTICVLVGDTSNIPEDRLGTEKVTDTLEKWKTKKKKRKKRQKQNPTCKISQIKWIREVKTP